MGTRVSNIRSRGFTLIEATLSMLMVSILIVSAMSGVGVVARQRAAIQERELAAGFAQSMLAAITGLRYADPNAASVTLGLDAGESGVATWDDVDDAASAVDLVPAEPLASRGWRWSASVAWVGLDASGEVGAESAAETGVKRVVVVVTRDGRTLARCWAIRSRGWDEVAR